MARSSAPDRFASASEEMKLRQRYKRLNVWNKIGFWAAIATFVALLLTIVDFLLPDRNIEAISSSLEFSGPLIAADAEDPESTCESIPDSAFKLLLGPSTYWSETPGKMTAVAIGGKPIVQLAVTEKGRLLIDAVVYSRDGRVVAEIVENEFHINRNNFFRKKRDPSSLIVFDQYGEEVLRAQYLNERHFRLSGRFLRPGHAPLIIGDSQIRLGAFTMPRMCGSGGTGLVIE